MTGQEREALETAYQRYCDEDLATRPIVPSNVFWHHEGFDAGYQAGLAVREEPQNQQNATAPRWVVERYWAETTATWHWRVKSGPSADSALDVPVELAAVVAAREDSERPDEREFVIEAGYRMVSGEGIPTWKLIDGMLGYGPEPTVEESKRRQRLRLVVRDIEQEPKR